MMKIFIKKILFYFIIECIDDLRLHYAFSKKIYIGLRFMKNDTAYVQKLHVLSKSFMHQAFLLKMCILCLEKNIFYLNNSFIQQAF